MPIDCTLVVGVDAKHLEQLSLTYPTWIKHKPSLLQRPLLIFCDPYQVSISDVVKVVGNHPDYTLVEWPPKDGITYPVGTGKFDNQQRHKMLAGFVHVPAMHVQTKYWLKIDTDTVAVGCDECDGTGGAVPVADNPRNDFTCWHCLGIGNTDNWIDPEWFADNPSIVSHPWGFTKPADQMLQLDAWVAANSSFPEMVTLANDPPLEMTPKPGWSRLKHRRIISWCAFFSTQFTQHIAAAATATCGPFQIPVPSQDGFAWYCAKRNRRGIVTPNMKSCGFQHWSTMKNIHEKSKESMRCK